MLRLRIIGGALDHQLFDFHSGKIYVMGRDVTRQGVVPVNLDSRTVSRMHCQIEFQKGVGFLIKDLDSSNGIRINRNKVHDAFLKRGDTIQVGEFTFAVENDGLSEAAVKDSGEDAGEKKELGEPTNAGANGTALSQASAISNLFVRPSFFKLLPQIAKKYWSRFESIDLSRRMLTIFMLAGFFGHWLVTAPLISDARIQFLEISFESARKNLRSFAERNRGFLAQESYGLLECKMLRDDQGLIEKFLFDPRGRMLCPPRSDMQHDSLVDLALQQGELFDNCRERIILNGYSNCELVYPLSDFKQNAGQYVSIGAAKIRYEPIDAFDSLQNLRALQWKTLFFLLALMGFIWWLWRRWMQNLVLSTAEGVHLAASGAVQSLEKAESFAAFQPLLQEINRLISQRNQGVTKKEGSDASEASFLQLLLQQVLLLEERAVMVVDRENHIIAGSPSLSAVIPVETNEWNRHLADAIQDTHLQGDLMSFLNDLSAGSEIVDRALSMADRVVQVRGMPLYFREEYVAALLLF